VNPALTTLVVVAALLVSSLLGSLVVTLVLRSASRSADAGVQARDEPPPEMDTPVERASGPRRGDEVADPGAQGAASPATSEPAPPSDRAVSDGPDGPRARAVLRGGMWIGLLERAAVTACVLAGDPAGIAIVVAIKGLGRYPELRENPGVSERFVIGTFASLLWAGLIGWIGLRLLAA
jgi:hypothetical protein